jgi:hypothetical protein
LIGKININKLYKIIKLKFNHIKDKNIISNKNYNKNYNKYPNYKIKKELKSSNNKQIRKYLRIK